jgi:hypothetical protein
MINIFTFQFNNAAFLEKQYYSFKKFLKRPHQLVCINNASDMRDKSKIFSVCSEYGIPNYYTGNIRHDKAGSSHQQALNWAWKSLISKHSDTVIIVDHDMFPIKEFNLYEGYDVAAVMQGRGEHIRYFHPGILIIHPSLKDRDQVDFTGEEIDGLRCDTGGNWHHYLKSHPDLKIKEMSLVDIQDDEFKENELQMCEDFLLHFRAGSNWNNAPKELFQKKVEVLNEALGL